MHDYLLSTEVVRFAFMFGVAVSMLLYERRHLTTGSIVVPGYIAVFIVYPLIIVATFINALISYALINKVLRRWFLLYGRTKFTVLALVSILIQTAMLKFTPSGPWLWESDFKLFVGVGYVVPALIAHDMGRQGIARTVKSVLLAGAIVATPITLALLLDLPGVNDLAPLAGVGDTAIDAAWIPLAVFLSAAAAWGVATNYGFRSGGFVGAAFIGMLLGDPWQVVVAGSVAILTYLVVTKLLMGSMILFGRRKFSAMLLVSSSLSWALLWVGTELFGVGAQEHLDLGSLALTPLFIPGLLANDTQRTGPRQVVFGVAAAGSFVLTTTWWVESLFVGVPLAIGWKLLAILSFVVIFWRQFVPEPAPVETAADVAAEPEVAAGPAVVATAEPEPVAAFEPEPVTAFEPEPVAAFEPEPVAATAEPEPVAAFEHEPVVAELELQPVEIVPAEAIELTPARPAFSFGRSGFERWASIHRDAADAAERWLSTMLGDADAPLAATATATGPTPAPSPPAAMPSNEPERHLHEARRGGEPVERTTRRLRRAAIDALSAPGAQAASSRRAEPSVVPHPAAASLDAARPAADPGQAEITPAATATSTEPVGPAEPADTSLPAGVDMPETAALPRRAQPSRRAGEFDSAATAIATSTLRPRPLMHRRPTGESSVWNLPVPQAPTARVLPDGRRATTSEAPGAATSRAHTAAPGAQDGDQRADGQPAGAPTRPDGETPPSGSRRD